MSSSILERENCQECTEHRPFFFFGVGKYCAVMETQSEVGVLRTASSFGESLGRSSSSNSSFFSGDGFFASGARAGMAPVGLFSSGEVEDAPPTMMTCTCLMVGRRVGGGSRGKDKNKLSCCAKNKRVDKYFVASGAHDDSWWLFPHWAECPYLLYDRPVSHKE